MSNLLVVGALLLAGILVATGLAIILTGGVPVPAGFQRRDLGLMYLLPGTGAVLLHAARFADGAVALLFFLAGLGVVICGGTLAIYCSWLAWGRGRREDSRTPAADGPRPLKAS